MTASRLRLPQASEWEFVIELALYIAELAFAKDWDTCVAGGGGAGPRVGWSRDARPAPTGPMAPP